LFGSGYVGDLQIKTGSTVNKTYTFKTLQYCSDDIYLRWIDQYGEYKYYAFKYGSEELVSKSGSTFNYYALNQEPSTLGLFKGRNQLKNKSVMKSISCGEPSADDKQTQHLDGLLKALKVWMYIPSLQWIEVTLKDMNIQRKRLEGRRTIEITIILPEYNTQSI